MGLNDVFFYSLTQRRFYNIYNGWQERRDAEQRERWEQTRNICWFSWTTPGKNATGMTIKKMMPFPWDETDETPDFSDMLPEDLAAEAAAANARWEERERLIAAQKQSQK